MLAAGAAEALGAVVAVAAAAVAGDEADAEAGAAADAATAGVATAGAATAGATTADAMAGVTADAATAGATTAGTALVGATTVVADALAVMALVPAAVAVVVPAAAATVVLAIGATVRDAGTTATAAGDVSEAGADGVAAAPDCAGTLKPAGAGAGSDAVVADAGAVDGAAALTAALALTGMCRCSTDSPALRSPCSTSAFLAAGVASRSRRATRRAPGPPSTAGAAGVAAAGCTVAGVGAGARGRSTLLAVDCCASVSGAARGTNSDAVGFRRDGAAAAQSGEAQARAANHRACHTCCGSPLRHIHFRGCLSSRSVGHEGSAAAHHAQPHTHAPPCAYLAATGIWRVDRLRRVALLFLLVALLARPPSLRGASCSRRARNSRGSSTSPTTSGASPSATPTPRFHRRRQHCMLAKAGAWYRSERRERVRNNA